MNTENLNIQLDARINLVRDAEPEKIASVSYSFGIGNLPTRDEVNAAIDKAISEVEEVTGDTGWRLTKLSDFGLADVPSLGWQRDE